MGMQEALIEAQAAAFSRVEHDVEASRIWCNVAVRRGHVYS